MLLSRIGLPLMVTALPIRVLPGMVMVVPLLVLVVALFCAAVCSLRMMVTMSPMWCATGFSA